MSNVRRVAVSLLVAYALSSLLGCSQPRTVVTGVTSYPKDADWQHATNWLVVEAEGQRGKAYVDFGKKDIRIVLFTYSIHYRGSHPDIRAQLPTPI